MSKQEIVDAKGRSLKNGRFTKGNTASKGFGRPRDSFNKASLLSSALNNTDVIALIDMIYDKAMAGDIKCAQLIFDCLPNPRSYIKSEALKRMKTIQEIDTAMDIALAAVGEGVLSLEDGADAFNLLEKRGNTILQVETYEMDRDNRMIDVTTSKCNE